MTASDVVQLEMVELTSTALIVLAYAGGEFPSIVPASIIEESDGIITEYIGTGPFTFEEWQQDHPIHFLNMKITLVERSLRVDWMVKEKRL